MYLEVVVWGVGGGIYLIMCEFLVIQANVIKVVCLHCTNVTSLFFQLKFDLGRTE